MATSADTTEIETSGGPSYPLVQDPDMEEDDFCPGAVFCLHPVYGDEDTTECTDFGDCKDLNQSFAQVASEVLWDKDVVNVCFLDKVPEKWKYKGKPIKCSDIIDWTNEAWCKDDKIPEFKLTERKDTADIRVSFCRKQGCWSMMGICATKKKHGPTMNLNLCHRKNQYHRPIEGDAHDLRIKSLVIHEFGHALGLEHEHQRSDFWDGVKDHLDLKRMKDDPRVKSEVEKAAPKKGVASCGADWFETKEGIKEALRKFFRVRRRHSEAKDDEDQKIQSAYDPQSIMHYGFDKDWIENQDYHNEAKIRADKDLPDSTKEYLIGILQTNGKLAQGPSELDIQTLKDAYTQRKAS